MFYASNFGPSPRRSTESLPPWPGPMRRVSRPWRSALVPKDRPTPSPLRPRIPRHRQRSVRRACRRSLLPLSGERPAAANPRLRGHTAACLMADRLTRTSVTSAPAALTPIEVGPDQVPRRASTDPARTAPCRSAPARSARSSTRVAKGRPGATIPARFRPYKSRPSRSAPPSSAPRRLLPWSSAERHPLTPEIENRRRCRGGERSRPSTGRFRREECRILLTGDQRPRRRREQPRP